VKWDVLEKLIPVKESQLPNVEGFLRLKKDTDRCRIAQSAFY
jgi:hypothetical protein